MAEGLVAAPGKMANGCGKLLVFENGDGEGLV